MPPLVSNITFILSVGIVLSHIIFGIGCIAFLFFKKQASPVFQWIAEHYLSIGFLVALGTTLGSLFYSEIAKFAPCELCWYNRIFLFSQVILFFVALLKKDARVVAYSFALSAVGFFISAYQVVLQWGVNLPIPCSADAGAVSCAKIYFTEFGYITIPFMAATAFALLLVLAAVKKIFSSSARS